MGIFTSSLSPQLNAVKPVSGTEDYMGGGIQAAFYFYQIVKSGVTFSAQPGTWGPLPSPGLFSGIQSEYQKCPWQKAGINYSLCY